MRVTEPGDFGRKKAISECNLRFGEQSLKSRGDLLRFQERSRTRSSCFGSRWQKSRFTICVLLVSVFITPFRVSGGEHLRNPSQCVQGVFEQIAVW